MPYEQNMSPRNGGGYTPPKPKPPPPRPRTSTSGQQGYADYLKRLAQEEGTQMAQYLMPNRNVQSSGVGSMTQANLRDGWSPSTNSYLGDQGALWPTITGGGGGGYGGYGGGGGGGGNAAAEAEAKRIAMAQAAAFQQLLGSKAFQARAIDGDLGRVGQAVSADQRASDSEYRALSKYMGGMENAYAGRAVAESPQVPAELLQLLAMSGGDGRSYQGEVALANTQGAQSTANGQRLMDRMGQVAAESRTSRVAEAEQARVFQGREIGSQKSAMEEALRARQRQEQQGLDSQKMQVVMELIKAMSAGGGAAVDVSQFFGGAT